LTLESILQLKFLCCSTRKMFLIMVRPVFTPSSFLIFHEASALSLSIVSAARRCRRA